MTHSIGVRHNFETAHRLPKLGGKCVNLHGHSWRCEIVVTSAALHDGIMVDFSDFKARVRGWIDTYLDHGAMLSADDPLAVALHSEGSRLFRFRAPDPSHVEKIAVDLAAPTVENVAEMIGRMSQGVLDAFHHAPGAALDYVEVRETSVNHARRNAAERRGLL